MNELSPTNLGSFLTRFRRCDDAVIKAFHYVLGGDGVDASIVVDIYTQDAGSDSGWSDIRIHVGGVRELFFKEGMTTNKVMSNGIYVAWFDGVVFVDFSPYSTEMESASDVRQSTFYVAGALCSWRTLSPTEGAAS